MDGSMNTGSVRVPKGAQANQVVRELLEVVTAQARGMWRYRWRAVIVMWAVSIVGWFFVYSLPPVYEANARIYVDTENAIRPLLQGIASSSNVMSEVTVVTREMLSRPNLAEVARTTDLDLRVEGDAQFESLLASLQRRIQVVGGRDNIFSISFEDQDRAKAIAVVEALVNTFVEKSLGADRSESSKAQSFLQEQIDEYEARLTAAEDNLAQFKRENMAMMPGQRGDYFTRLQASESALDESRAALRLALERRDELLRQIEGEEPVFGIMGTTPASSGAGGGFSSAKIRELESQLEELRLQYTDKHPRIGQILQTIELLKEQQADELAAASASGVSQTTASPLEQNPVYQNMRIQLTNTEVEIASLRADVNQQQRDVAELRTLVDTVPQVEAELGRLNRDYGVVKGKYEQLLEQLETANIGEDVEQSIDDVQFRIIDPPFSALEPSGPQRQLLLAGVLIVALGVGGALTFLLNQVHPVFFTSREISSGIGIPVLGTVGLFLSPSELSNRRSSHLRFFTAIGFLVVSFALVSLFSEQLSPLVRGLAGMRI
jgi:polysaccharide chain length determinant protein (PEP-CTERM system associated)